MHVATDGASGLKVSGPHFDREKEEVYFRFIHIPDRRGSRDKRTYRILGLSPFVPSKYDDAIPHYDPDLENFTYSEPLGRPRAAELELLLPGDFLFFAASLAPAPKEGYENRSATAILKSQQTKMAKYLVGYFQVYNCFQVRRHDNEPKISPEGPVLDEVRSRLRKNAHFETLDSHDFVCVVGVKETNRSKLLLRRAIRFTQFGSPFKPTPFGIGFQGTKNFPRGFKRLTKDQVEVGLSRAKPLADISDP